MRTNCNSDDSVKAENEGIPMKSIQRMMFDAEVRAWNNRQRIISVNVQQTDFDEDRSSVDEGVVA